MDRALDIRQISKLAYFALILAGWCAKDALDYVIAHERAGINDGQTEVLVEAYKYAFDFATELFVTDQDKSVTGIRHEIRESYTEMLQNGCLNRVKSMALRAVLWGAQQRRE